MIDLSLYPLGTKFRHRITGYIFTVMRTLHHQTLKPTYYLYSKELDFTALDPSNEDYELAESVQRKKQLPKRVSIRRKTK